MTTYDFHGKLYVRLLSQHRGYEKYIANEYARIAKVGDAAGAAPTIDVSIVSRIPVAQEGDLTGRVRFKKLFTFEYLIRGIDTDAVTIYFKRHWIDSVYMNAVGVFLQAQILEPIMYMKLLEQRALLMHAGGVSHDGRGIVLPAHGGTGKTTLSMALLSQGSTLLGDDLLFVEADTLIVHPYPRPLHIFTYNVKNLLGATIPFKYRFAVYTKNVLRFILERLLKTEFLISTRIHADELFEGEIFGSSVPIKGVGFLQREGEAMRTVVITPSNVEEIAAAIAASADLNESLEDLLATRRDLVDDFRRRELEIVSALLTSVGRLTYVNTRQLDLTELSGLRARLLESSAAVE